MIAPFLWSLPWVIGPLVVLWRARASRSLDEVSDEVPGDAPLVSVVIPARNEQRGLERCVRSVLASRYPALDVIVVDDHSTDRTGEIVREIMLDDSRLHLLEAPDLPADWFGKQWACATGARAARGELLLFTDADTWHAPDLLPRAVNALNERRADLLSVGGHQEMHSFWERIIQPQMFVLLLARYGSTEHVSRATRPVDAIANGQFILIRRVAYQAMGGHERVRGLVAEDVSLAQEYVRAGRRIALLVAMHQLSTHMYASLAEVIRGWRKNLYAGGRYAAPGGVFGRIVFPLALLALPIAGLVPPLALLLSAMGILSPAWLIWSEVATIVAVLFWVVIYRVMGQRIGYSLLYPLGLGALMYIAAGSIARGRKVEWKDRRYVAR